MPAEPANHWSVAEEHLREAGFYWEAWERALRSPRLDLRQVAVGYEELLCGNLEGLAASGKAGAERLLEPALREDSPLVVSSAAFALLTLPDGFLRVRAALSEVDESRRAAIGRALALSRRPQLEREVEPLLHEKNWPLATAALTVFAARRLDPGPQILDLLAADDPFTMAAALRAARFSREPVRTSVERAAGLPHPLVRATAIEAGLVLGYRSAFTTCRERIEANDPEAAFALPVLGMGGDLADLPRLETALKVPDFQVAAVIALGLAGRRSSVERLLDLMEDPTLAQVAGEAFSAITGIPIEGPLCGEEPDESEEPAVADGADQLDSILQPTAAPDLPWPFPDAVRAAWVSTSKQLDPSKRLLLGKPISLPGLHEALRTVSMRRRHWLAFELAVRTRGEHQIHTRDFALAQLRTGFPVLSAHVQTSRVDRPFSNWLT